MALKIKRKGEILIECLGVSQEMRLGKWQDSQTANVVTRIVILIFG